VIARLGLVPKGPFRDLLHELTDYDGDRQVVLLIESSFTERGIDPDALADALGNSGRVAAVQRLAVGGAPHLERLYYLKEYLAHAKQKPKLVLFEIAGGYDSGPCTRSTRCASATAWGDDGRFERVVGITLVGGRRSPRPGLSASGWEAKSSVNGSFTSAILGFCETAHRFAGALPITSAGRLRRRASVTRILRSCLSKWPPHGI
jgi:hypothetical protein